MRKRTSKVWTIDEYDFVKIVKESKSIADVLRNCDMNTRGGNFQTVKSRIEALNLDTSHFLSRIDASNLTRKMTKERLESEILIENKGYNNHHLKNYIVKFGLMDYKCDGCGNTGEHMNKPLVLQLDHRNGINDDNRLENLRFLCPNCHSQTPTYAGKRFKSRCSCGEVKRPKSIKCDKCSRSSRSKIKWPSIDRMTAWVWEEPTSKIANVLGVSDKAVQKFCNKHNIDKPSRGYWAKNKT